MRVIEAPTFPLSRAEFRRAIRTGHGRAMQHVLRGGGAGAGDELVEATGRHPAYDPQVAGPRAPWLVDMAVRLDLGARIVDAIRREQPTLTQTFWDLDHRCSMLRELATRGVPGARELLYSMLAPIPGSVDVVAARQLVELDGADGLVFVARRLGEWLAADPCFWVDDELVRVLSQRDGSDSALAVLEAAAARDADVARYLGAVRRTSHERDPEASFEAFVERMRKITAEVVIRRVREDPEEMRIELGGWGRHVDDDARRSVFAALLEESRPSRIERFLRVFAGVGPPHLDDRLFTWAEADDEAIAWEAVGVLSNVTAPPVRELGLRILDIGRTAVRALRLLRRNFAAGDHRIIERTLVPLDDRYALHLWLADAIEVFRANPVGEGAPAVLFAYEYTPCENCRLDALKLLDTLGATPAWILEEARLDASEEIRVAVRGRG